jgi:PAS domain S-box-containing protein
VNPDKSRHAKILEQLEELALVLDIYSKVPAMIVVYNINTGEYIYVNESVVQLLGYAPSSFLHGGMSFAASLVHPDDVAKIMQANAEALKKANNENRSAKQGEIIATFEYRMQHKNGTWRWLHSDGTVFRRDDAGKVEYVMNVSVDITKRRNAEDASKQALLQEITERKKKEKELADARTSFLASEQKYTALIREINDRKHHEKAIQEDHIKERVLHHQHRQMALLNRAKDEFISVASHHLRTPVTAVKTYLAMLKEGYAGKLSKDQMAYLDQAFESNEQQLQVIDDILNVAEIDTQQVIIRTRKSNVVRLTREVIDSLKAKFDGRNQQVHFTTSQPVIHAPIDSVKFRIVLENLIGNASKYSPNGTQIYVRITELKRSIRFSVTDEGMGITPQDIDKIFEKFARVRNQSFKSETGTGLGLYWAKKIVELHNGSIRVRSELKKGSTFTVLIPRFKPNKTT